MKTNEKGLSIIKNSEGKRLDIYRCPAGFLTGGIGHRVEENCYAEGQLIDSETIDYWFKTDIKKREYLLNDLIEKENVVLTSNQYSALISLIFNVGFGTFERSRMWQKICKKDFAGAASEFDGWDKAGGKVLPGLTARRAAEKELFLS
jgi:lysozyme